MENGEKKIRIKEVLSKAWDYFEGEYKFFLIVGAVVAFIQFGQTFMEKIVGEDSRGLVAILGLVFTLVGMWISIGAIRLVLNYIREKKKDIDDLFSGAPFLFRYILGSIVYALIVFAGLILLVVPGIVWAIKYQFYAYFIVDQKMGPIEALKASGKITSGHKIELLFLTLVIGIINIAGVLAFGIGVLVTIPVSLLALGWVYLYLSDQIIAVEDESSISEPAADKKQEETEGTV